MGNKDYSKLSFLERAGVYYIEHSHYFGFVATAVATGLIFYLTNSKEVDSTIRLLSDGLAGLLLTTSAIELKKGIKNSKKLDEYFDSKV